MLDSIGRCFVIFTISCSQILPKDISKYGHKKNTFLGLLRKVFVR